MSKDISSMDNDTSKSSLLIENMTLQSTIHFQNLSDLHLDKYNY